MTAATEATAPPRPGRLPWLNGALLLAVGVMALRPTTVTWDTNVNYSYGWWIPLVCLFLFWERWPGRPAREPSGERLRLIPLVTIWGLIFFALRLATEADPDWRPGLWALGLLYIGALLGWLRLYGGTPWLRHFAFPVCFLILSLPWFFGIEQPLTQGLMRWNASLAAGSLRLLGIPGIAEGNVIELATCKLGVEEACSGILSLQSSVMLGFLLGEIYRLDGRRRVALVLLTMTLALVGNYGRTLFLALLAAFHGNGAVEAWHDTAGYSILVFTGVGSWLICLCLREDTTETAPPVAAREAPIPDPWRPAHSFAVAIFAAAALSEAGTQAWFGYCEMRVPHHPAWTAQLPQTPTFKPQVLAETARETLFCDDYKAGTWQDDAGRDWTAYWFRYDPKPSNRVVLGWHNPDSCLPSVGLKKDEDFPDFTASVNGLDLYVQPRRFLTADKAIYVFWLVYPMSGSLAPGLRNDPTATVSSKFTTHLRDVWHGSRGVGVETLEVGLTGPADYASAKAAYLDFLKQIAQPVAPIR